MLERMAKNDADKYQSFWKEFGLVLKEGPAEDFSNKEKKTAQRNFFKNTYHMLIDQDTGPRLPTFLIALGKEKSKQLLEVK
jgi:HSP90 family molecular chaperone